MKLIFHEMKNEIFYEETLSMRAISKVIVWQFPIFCKKIALNMRASSVREKKTIEAILWNKSWKAFFGSKDCDSAGSYNALLRSLR